MLEENLEDSPVVDGSDTDHFGNTISWRYTEDDGLITFFAGKNEITTWCCEIEPSDCFVDFMRVWNLAQKSNPKN